MPNYLDDLLELLPDDVLKPTAEHVNTMRETDQVRATDTSNELYATLRQLEKELMPFLNIGHQDSYNSYKGSKHFGTIPKDMESVRVEHGKRMAALQSVVTLPGVAFEDGKIKSEESIQRKIFGYGFMEQRCEPDGKVMVNMGDISRARLVCENLLALDFAYLQVAHLRSRGYHQIGYSNYYNDDQVSRSGLPFRGVNHMIARFGRMGDPDADALITSIQLVTERVRAVMDLDHPFSKSIRVFYPSDEHATWITRQYMKASILDLEDFHKEYFS